MLGIANAGFDDPVRAMWDGGYQNLIGFSSW